MRALLFGVILAAVGATCAGQTQADQLSPPAAYAQALSVMDALTTSPYAVFTTTVNAAGFGVALQKDDGFATLGVGFGRAFARAGSWHIALRSADGYAVIRDSAGVTTPTRSQLFKPTWQGAYQWTRYGFGHATVAAPQSATPAPGATDDASTTVIGRSYAIAPGAYRIEDGTPLACPDGSRGRHLQLTAVVSPENHPLTDVVIDEGAGRICTMRFNIARGNAFSLTGTFELDFGARANYWVVVHGSAQVVFRVFGLGAKHASMAIDYTDFAFTTEPPEQFGVPKTPA